MTKTLILVRHAHALSRYEAHVTTDAERPLSAQGEQKALQTAQALRVQKVAPQIILTSPLLRAVQTAEILAQTLRIPVQKESLLDGFHPDNDVRDFLLEQFEHFSAVIAVSHNPAITYVNALLSGQVIPFSAGDFTILDMSDLEHPKLIFTGAEK